MVVVVLGMGMSLRWGKLVGDVKGKRWCGGVGSGRGREGRGRGEHLRLGGGGAATRDCR